MVYHYKTSLDALRLSYVEREAALLDTQLKYSKKVEELQLMVRNTEANILTAAASARRQYEEDFNTLNVEYTTRMHNSEERATYYRSLSEGSESKYNHLIDHTSRLDKHIEEGRQLVIELRNHIVVRDTQIAELHKQLESLYTLTNNLELNAVGSHEDK